jgi:hypothetical protein
MVVRGRNWRDTNLEEGLWSVLEMLSNEILNAALSGTCERDEVFMMKDPVILMFVQGFIRPNPLKHTVVVSLWCLI